MDEKDDQVPAAIRLSERRVNVFTRTIASFDKAEVGSIAEDFRHFVLFDAVLSPQLLDDVFEPDEADDLQARILSSTWASFLPGACWAAF